MLDEEEEAEVEEALETADAEHEGEDDRGRRRRRRRRRRHEEGSVSRPSAAALPETVEVTEEDGERVEEDNRTGGDDREADEEGDGDRRRRRRGRRGGRRRVRREGDLEGPQPASDTVEILPSTDTEEIEPELVEARTSWPVEIGAVAIETASLPALAGDSFGNSPGDFGELGAPSENQSPPTEAGEHADLTAPPAPDGNSAPAEGASYPAALPTAETEQGVPYLSTTERILDLPSSPAAPEPSPAHPVQTVTEKPANPRRGWWQRLIQP
jgi:ribonuclease E